MLTKSGSPNAHSKGINDRISDPSAFSQRDPPTVQRVRAPLPALRRRLPEVGAWQDRRAWHMDRARLVLLPGVRTEMSWPLRLTLYPEITLCWFGQHRRYWQVHTEDRNYGDGKAGADWFQKDQIRGKR
jgi:hypothetical protein